MGTTAIGAGSASALLAETSLASAESPLALADNRDGNGSHRANTAEKIRREAAINQKTLPEPDNQPNNDETLYASRIGSFGKCLPHNKLGEVDLAAFAALVKAMKTATPADFEAIPLGGPTKLQNPQAGIAFDLQGPDSHALWLRKPPAFASAETAAEMVELYWQALTRDVPYKSYATNPLIVQAAAELSGMTGFTGPKSGGQVTPDTIFRCDTAGDLVGPYISQFLLRDIPFGAMTVKQQIEACVPDVDFMTSYETWLACQNGGAQGSDSLDPRVHYIRNARDLGEYVHRDYSYQPYPVGAAADGLSLQPWTAAPLTVGHELTKLAGIIAMGRDAAGVHWRSDGVEGIKLGEALALNYLAETRALWNERFDGFSITRFDGTTVMV